ncbi:hypothetical protein L1987_31506 [Smallanthus sonchifolius]|uniref:Uncharacterized protein n=1 Tax=Smallanthus sonchifolius TaxID=185202 RepID=A0ACB9I5T8_9ASTR|nr:hypothetical protein L1987_31506 [Smallanthus sonchifolius]
MVHIILSVNCRQLITIPLQQGGSVVEKRVGSSPPSCEHKCYGCSPCEAIQVPANGGHVNVSIHKRCVRELSGDSGDITMPLLSSLPQIHYYSNLNLH